MMTALTIIHVIISFALIVVVLMQHGKQQGLSGAIAGGAETFFGKNKGRTIDAMLKKFTAVVAVLFIVSSVVFAAVAINEYNSADSEAQTQTQTQTTEDAASQGTFDENGNLVDENGNILINADDIKKADEGSAEGEETQSAPAESQAPAETGSPEASQVPAE